MFRERLYRARIHGIEAVLHCNSPRGYDDRFKLQVVKSVAEGRPKMGRKPKPKLSGYEPGSAEYRKLEN